jgi:cytochrome P450
MEYDPFSIEMQEDPYSAYRYFRDQEPCSYNPKWDFYALFRFEDVWNATLDWQTYSSRLGHNLSNRTESGEAFSIIGMDPPRHVRLRNLISRGFTPRRIQGLEGQIRAIVCGYLDQVRDLREFDVQAVLGNRYPMDVICSLLGLPKEIRDTYRGWMDRMLERDPVTGEPPPDAAEGVRKAREYLRARLEERMAEPQEDLLTVLVSSEYEDIDGVTKPLTFDEMLNFAFLVGSAGAETTQKLLGNCMVLLARHPDQRKRIWEDPTLLAPAIDEILRYEAPSQFQGRVAQRDVEIHGVTIPEGARVALVTGAACRDDREFDDPDHLDIDRRPDRELYFGFGPHVCIGKSLARLEARVMLEEVRDRFPNYEVDESGLRRTRQAHVRGYTSVPIRVS